VEGWRDRLESRLTRRTSSGRYIAEIDGLRFVAIAMVVLFHSQLRVFEASGGEIGEAPPAHNMFDLSIGQGRFGVHLFFIISGFVLALPFAAERLAGARPVRLKAFYLRRLTRLEPPYFVLLTLYFLLGSTTHLWKLWSDYQETLLPRFGAGLIYAHRFLFSGEPNPILPPTWSLEIEVQFYLMVPLLALVFTIQHTAKRRALMIGGAAFAAIFQWLMFESVGVLPPVLLSYLQFFLVGFLLADVFLLEWHQEPSRGWTWDAIGLVGIVDRVHRPAPPERAHPVGASARGASLPVRVCVLRRLPWPEDPIAPDLSVDRHRWWNVLLDLPDPHPSHGDARTAHGWDREELGNREHPRPVPRARRYLAAREHNLLRVR
jgi:Acyltransferase family